MKMPTPQQALSASKKQKKDAIKRVVKEFKNNLAVMLYSIDGIQKFSDTMPIPSEIPIGAINNTIEKLRQMKWIIQTHPVKESDTLIASITISRNGH